jgi:hypothetical protein
VCGTKGTAASAAVFSSAKGILVMMIDTNTALDLLSEAIDWSLKPALDSQTLFDDIASKLHQRPEFKRLTIVQLDLLLADLKREFARSMHTAEWQLYDAFRTAIGED